MILIPLDRGREGS